MDESHDQNFMQKFTKIWSKTCVFCCEKYPIPTIILISFFLLYLFFPLVFKILIYSFPLVGIFLLVQRHLSCINQEKVKHVEEDRRRKFAKSRRSFKSRNHLIRRKNLNKHDDYNDTKDDDDDDIFLKSLSDLLTDKKSKGTRDVKFESVDGFKGECSSSNGNVDGNKDVSKDDIKPQDQKVVQWMEDNQNNDMDLGLSEPEGNKRLQSLMQRRRSRKNLGFEEGGSTGNNNKNVQISAVKTMKINPFLEVKSSGKISPGSAPSTLLTTTNPFDLPYDPHEEKLDLTGDNFHEEFTVVQPKEPVFCRHQSFSLGAFAHPVIARDDDERSCCKDLSNKQKSVIGFETSTLADTGGDNKHVHLDSPISDDSIDSNHPTEEGTSSKQAAGEDETEITPEEKDSFDERKADINFFYGMHKKAHHVANISIVSDLQVELSDEDNVPTLDDVDIEKARETALKSSNSQEDLEMNENPKPLSSDPIQSNHIHEPHGAGHSFVAQSAPAGLEEVAVAQAPVSSSSPKSVLQRDYSADLPLNFINEAHQPDNQTRETDSSDSVLHHINDSGEQDQNVHQL
ncbi:hypothetical protein QVD17_34429 [Tagetes erecta]|uniref:Uncharacterized protein n=1 Tax=Tagetes erecta TaxID=13708 RepID=A0AAD8NEH3_TARER|nr:hypothetical protein QVD17_34429 [Tagetes erecta]